MSVTEIRQNLMENVDFKSRTILHRGRIMDYFSIPRNYPRVKLIKNEGISLELQSMPLFSFKLALEK